MTNFRFYLPFLGWFILCSILLTLPGSAFPKEDWLDGIMFDKWVHIGLFSIMTWFLCWAFYKTTNGSSLVRYFVYAVIIGVIYGVGMEFVQKHFVPNRSFDNGDIIADAIGSVIGGVYSYIRYIKNRPL